jgi:enoyl-CoA hydratase/carnithine racemase
MNSTVSREESAAAPLIIKKHREADWLMLNRPQRLNALDETLTIELLEYFEARRRDRSTRVIVLTGAGRGFCSGADLRAKVEDGEKPLEGLMNGDWRLRDLMSAMRDCPQPIIALVNGPAAGGGLALALASDVVVAAESAVFLTAFIDIGISGAELGVSWRLQRAVGTALARDMCFTNRKVSAREALECALVSRVVADTELAGEGLRIVDAMLRAAPDALRLTKRSLDAALESGFCATMEMEERAQLFLLRTKELRGS